MNYSTAHQRPARRSRARWTTPQRNALTRLRSSRNSTQRSITYASLLARAHATADALARSGLQAGESRRHQRSDAD